MRGKLEVLCVVEGKCIMTILADHPDATCPGICSNPACNWTTLVGRNEKEGLCERCNTNTVVSARVLMTTEEEK